MPIIVTPLETTVVTTPALSETVIFQQARDVLGNSEENALAEIYIPDEAIRPTLRPILQQLNRLYGSSDAKREELFETISGQQDYSIVDWIADDVLNIQSVTRSGATLGEVPLWSQDAWGVEAGSAGGVIPQGYQQSAMDEILAQERARRVRKYDWEVANVSGVKYLRLMPVPSGTEYVEVIYVTDGFSIATLPAAAETALVYGVCVAVIDAMINRLNSQKRIINTNFSPSDGDNTSVRLEALVAQRDRYEKLFSQVLVNLSGA